MSVTAARGFRAAGATTGDHGVALVLNDGPGWAAATVLPSGASEATGTAWTRQVATDGRIDAVLIDSGGVHARSGPEGFLDTHVTAELVADVLGRSAGDVAVCSTGSVADPLPVELLLESVRSLGPSLDAGGGTRAAAAISATDEPGAEVVDAGGWVVGGMATGAAPPGPALVVLTTDALADAADLDRALGTATSGTAEAGSATAAVLLLASGASGVRPPLDQLAGAVTRCCADLLAVVARRSGGRADGPVRDDA